MANRLNLESNVSLGTGVSKLSVMGMAEKVTSKVLNPFARILQKEGILRKSSSSSDDGEASTSSTYLAPMHGNTLVINCSGVLYQTKLSTLMAIPDTRLSKLAAKHDPARTLEYFFDRHPIVFGSVINYYRTGELHVPMDVCGVVIRRELTYWQIDPDKTVQSCCWLHYCEHLEDHESLGAKFDFAIEQDHRESDMIDAARGWRRTRLQIWRLLSRPATSKLAFVYLIITIVFTALSIADVVFETLPGFTETVNMPGCHDSLGRIIQTERPRDQTKKLMVTCVVFFSCDITVRLLTSPSPLRELLTATIILEILSLSPFYVSFILDAMCYGGDGVFRRVFEVFHVLRVCRIFFALGHFKPFRVLVLAVKASTYELLVLLMFYIAAVVFFGFVIYYAEEFLSPKRTDALIKNIPLGLWYSLITVTTVGYGDTYPVTWGGYVLGVLCQLVGVILLALTIPVISSNFLTYYAYAKSRDPRRPNAKPRGPERDGVGMSETRGPERDGVGASEKGEKTDYEEADNCEILERTTTLTSPNAAIITNRLRDHASNLPFERLEEKEVEERTTQIGNLHSRMRDMHRLSITEENELENNGTSRATSNNEVREAGPSEAGPNADEENKVKERPSTPVLVED